MSSEKIKTKEEFMEYFDSLNHDDQEAVLESMMISVGILTEDAVCRDISNSIYIAITPDTGRNFDKDPYFKVSNKPINKSNPNVARISMRTGDYVIHNGFSLEIPSKIINKINEILGDKKYISSNYSSAINGWDALLLAIARYYGIDADNLRKQFPRILINPNSNVLKGCVVKKWGK